MKVTLMQHIRENAVLYLAILFFFMIGITSGIFTIIRLPENQFAQISGFLDSFFSLLKKQTPNIGSVLIQSLINNFRLVALIAFCGFSVFCMPVMLILMSVKGFMIGFTVSALVMQFEVMGVIVCFLCVIPPNIITVMCYLRLGVDSYLNGLFNFRRRKGARGASGVPRFGREYCSAVMRISLFCMASVIIEAVMAPFVLQIFAGAIAV